MTGSLHGNAENSDATAYTRLSSNNEKRHRDYQYHLSGNLTRRILRRSSIVRLGCSLFDNTIRHICMKNAIRVRETGLDVGKRAKAPQCNYMHLMLLKTNGCQYGTWKESLAYYCTKN